MSDSNIVNLSTALNRKSAIIGKINKTKELISKVNCMPKDEEVKKGRDVNVHIADLTKSTLELIEIKKIISQANSNSGIDDLIIEKNELASLIQGIKTSLSTNIRYRTNDDIKFQLDDVDALGLVDEYERRCEEIQTKLNELNTSVQVILP